MRVFIVLAALVAVASAGHLGGYGGAALISTGTSSQFRSEDNYGNYNFGYDESHATGGSSRRESQTNGVRHGSYSLSDADGRRRMVNYVADAAGFRATIDTNEPGVEPKDPAAVLINKNGYNAGPVGYASPVVAEIAAPVVAPAPVFAAPRAYGPAPVAVAAPAYGLAHGPAYGEGPVYAEAPRAFSYSFGATHVAPVAAPVYAAPAPIAAPAYAPAPIYSERPAY